MRRAFILFTAMAVATILASGVAMTQPAGSNGPDRYIIVLKDSVDDPGQVAGEISRRNNAEVGFVYRNALKGFSATIPNERVDEVRNNSQVAYVERDATAHAFAQTLPWGIDRIDADTSSTEAGDGIGAVSNVKAYVIDSGIYKTHPDLNVVNHVNFASGKNDDCNGHGTHVAGTVAARDDASDVVGVAPGAPLTGVKVLGCSGSGSYSGVIKGVDWVTANAERPAIANMSLGGPTSQALDDAVKRSANSGVFYSLAAGNDGEDACKSSPARAGAGTNNGVVTTAATGRSDAETSWSNYGSCVDVWAPGASILSTKKGGGTTTMSGTSMAAPHVGGTGALYLSGNPGATPAAVETALKTDSELIIDNTSKNGAPIQLVYAGGY